MSSHFPIGVSDFRKMREEQLEYVDKSHFICELVDKRGVEVLLLPRPRRFGKTLNLSMLRYFFGKREEDLSHLFQDLHVWRAGEAYRGHFQRYPVLYMTFKDVKSDRFDGCWEAIRKKIEVLFDEHRHLLDSRVLSEREVKDFSAVLDGTASRTLYERALFDLSTYLHRHHNEKVMILIDEYDEPIHAGYACGYTSEVLAFFRAFLTAGLKDNPHLFKAVLTGILRVARESIFSGLNNLAVYSLLHSQFSTCFGFTEPEVEALLDKAGLRDRLEPVRAWYNGYVFGETIVYNPWSVLNFLASKASDPQPFWVSTSSNDLIKDLLQHHALDVQPTFEIFLEGGFIERVIDENVVLGQLQEDEGTLWSLLVFSGYLKAEKRSRGPMERPLHRLSIPNREVREVYTTTFRQWMQQRMKGRGANLDKLTRSLLQGDSEELEEQLQAFTTNVLSYHDPGTLDPEQVYHGFVIGLLAVLEPEYQVRSNRESGQGRPDVMIRPREPGNPGVVLELKVAKPPKKTLDQALEQGLEQIRANDYPAELRAAGASPVHAFAVAFDGKVVRVNSLSDQTG
jgi:hypothetical protein